MSYKQCARVFGDSTINYLTVVWNSSLRLRIKVLSCVKGIYTRGDLSVGTSSWCKVSLPLRPWKTRRFSLTLLFQFLLPEKMKPFEASFGNGSKNLKQQQPIRSSTQDLNYISFACVFQTCWNLKPTLAGGPALVRLCNKNHPWSGGIL